MKPRHLNAQEWDEVRLEYETSRERPTLRQLADKHRLSRSTVFKKAAREKWKHNVTLVEAAKKQIIEKVDASLEAATTEAAQVAVKEMMAQLQPWIEYQKTEHIKRAVKMATCGFELIERLWEVNQSPEARAESLAAATLDKHDQIIRRNLGMNETQRGSGTLNLDVLVAGGRTIVSAQKPAA